MLEIYYLAAERPALVSLYTTQREIVSYLGAILGRPNVSGRAASSFIANMSIASTGLEQGAKLGTKPMVFQYGYFANSMCLSVPNNGREILLLSSYDKGAVNVATGSTKSQGLMQMSHIPCSDPDATVATSALGFGNGDQENESFISCVSVDPTPGLGTTIMVGYSSGAVEIWKQSVSVSDPREAVCEAVAQCQVPSYPFYCGFGPCGELAVLLTVDDMYLMEWTGAKLSGIKMVEGSSADYWTRTRIKVVAAEWLNFHELLTMSENGQLWLSRRSEMGYWQRVAQYILVDRMPEESVFTSWISRIQYDGNGHLYVKMQGSHQLMQLKWDKKAVPVMTIVDLPMKDTGALVKPTKDDPDCAGSLKIADFVLEPYSSLLVVAVSDRSMVCVYNFPSMRFLHVIDPPKPYLKAGGMKFINAGSTSQAYLAIKWVEMSLELFQEQGNDFDVEQKVSHRRGSSLGRLTVVYSVQGGNIKPANWQDQTLADILAGSDNSVVTSHVRCPKNSIYRVREQYTSEPMPKLSIFRPTFPEKVVSGTKNTAMFEDAFAHRAQVFGRHLPKNDTRVFPMDRTYIIGSRKEAGPVEPRVFKRDEVPLGRDPDTRVYSMEEFSRRQRGGFQ